MDKIKVLMLSFWLVSNVNCDIIEDLRKFSNSEGSDVPASLINVKSISLFRDIFYAAINNSSCSNENKYIYHCGTILSSVMYAIIVNDISWIRNVKYDVVMWNKSFSAAEPLVNNKDLLKIKQCAEYLILNTPYCGDVAYAGTSQPFPGEVRKNTVESLKKIDVTAYNYLNCLKKISNKCLEKCF